MRSSSPGPDFLCIGMQKAGTGWLFDQLDFDENFWMPPVKELHYLDNTLKRSRSVLDNMYRRGNRDLAKYNEERRQRNRRPLDERDLIFLASALRIRGHAINLNAYAELFRPKGDLLSGDITPSYSTLSDDTISGLAQRFPALKIVLLVRDPVERSWSLLNMKMRKGSVAEEEAGNRAAIRKIVMSPPFAARSYATGVWQTWAKRFPQNRIRYFLFDDLVSNPLETRDDICSFLGVHPDKSRGGLAPEFNRKAARTKLPMSDEVRNMLRDLYADELKRSAALFGGAAATWPSRYGLA
jgi:hypothetical protein